MPDDGIAVPLELDTDEGRLSLLSTTTVFGTPTDVTLSELAMEAFYPADEATGERLRGCMRQRRRRRELEHQPHGPAPERSRPTAAAELANG